MIVERRKWYREDVVLLASLAGRRGIDFLCLAGILSSRHQSAPRRLGAQVRALSELSIDFGIGRNCKHKSQGALVGIASRVKLCFHSRWSTESYAAIRLQGTCKVISQAISRVGQSELEPRPVTTIISRMD